MDDYISRQVILKHLEKCKGQPPEMCYSFAVISEIERFVKSQLAADVVPVVRCKDCIYGESDGVLDGYRWCSRFDNIVGENDFCSFGEKEE